MVSIYIHDAVGQVAELHQDLLKKYPSTWTVAVFLSRQADHLYAQHQKGNEAVCVQIGNWLPRLVGADTERIMQAPFALDDARITVAREYGFEDWAAVQEYGTQRLDKAFERAVEAVTNGDAEALRAMLRRRPSLAKARSLFGHRATLLHYVTANGVETWRQKVPENAGEITRLLVAAGAEVAAPSLIYGGGQDTMALLMSSAHPRAAGVTHDIAKVLVGGGMAG